MARDAGPYLLGQRVGQKTACGLARSDGDIGRRSEQKIADDARGTQVNGPLAEHEGRENDRGAEYCQRDRHVHDGAVKHVRIV